VEEKPNFSLYRTTTEREKRRAREREKEKKNTFL
jgi:hypothetical protein